MTRHRMTGMQRLILQARHAAVRKRTNEKKAIASVRRWPESDQTDVYVMVGHGVDLCRAVRFIKARQKRQGKDHGERKLDL